jgi:hypothetical protein
LSLWPCVGRSTAGPPTWSEAKNLYPPQLCKQLRRITDGVVWKGKGLAALRLAWDLRISLAEPQFGWFRSGNEDLPQVGDHAMKTTLLMLCLLLCATAAFGQSALAGPALTQVYTPADHAQHASVKPMAQDQDLRGCGTIQVAHGERPLWEFASATRQVPLGDVARFYRQQHVAMKKAVIVKEN